jgi:nucleoside-diphosphate-sugar epimerase
MNRIALVIGVTGGIGNETARALLAHGWTVRALCRDPQRAKASLPDLHDVDFRAGDAMNPSDVVAAATGVSVVVHAANPPGYRNWAGLVLPMLESSIAAAKASGARLVLPGTVYNFGPDAPELLDEAAAQNPHTRKGKLRVAMEQRLRRASTEGTPVLIVRAGDFFGPRAQNSWFSQGVVKPGRPLRHVTYPGQPDASHAFAYLPDLATTIARLLGRAEQLRPFASPRRGRCRARKSGLRNETPRRAGGPSRCFISQATLSSAASTSPRRREGPPAFRARPFGAFLGLPSTCSHRSSRPSARCSRCATCGSDRCASTTPSCAPSWAKNRTLRSSKRCASPSLSSAACPRLPRSPSLPRRDRSADPNRRAPACVRAAQTQLACRSSRAVSRHKPSSLLDFYGAAGACRGARTCEQRPSATSLARPPCPKTFRRRSP